MSNEPEFKYTDRDQRPPDDELTESHQVWVWLAGANPPHWEIRGTGMVVPDYLRRRPKTDG